ncbi:hypothetical protein [Curtobacterium sp. MCBA15_001]|uniref:hypothetical protein n=1 Tax=Curtobacterium sp. MCBA15_001 TaxID=1898731 RepID=UPI0008DD4510|nr:hypothetical protein [Curtobacterium sp. MCBA15_001]OIH95391.1 hypothetical protein BIU90_01410 [Curtobacterium sp. MCBA15_001]
MSLPPDDRQNPDRDDRAREPRHAAPTDAGASPGSRFAPISLRPAVDVQAVQDRLRDLGQSRSTEALAERAELLRLLGRLDEALVVAEEVFRLTMFTGERSDKVAARIRRAHVLHDLGRHERAATESALARDTATTEEWPELEGAAAEIEGWSLFELNRFEEARQVLGRSYEAFRTAGAPAERTEALRSAVEAAMRASIASPLVEPERPRADGARTEAPGSGAPRTDADRAEGTDRPRTAREAAMRRDTDPETRFAEPVQQVPPVRRRVLGAPDAARTEDDTLWGKLTDRRRPSDREQ